MKNISEKLVSLYNDEVEVITTNSFYGPESILFKKIDLKQEVINGVDVNRLPFHRWQYPLIKYSGKFYGKIFNRSLPYKISKYRWGLYSPAIEKAMILSNADVIMATTINYNFCDYPSWRFKTKNPKPFVLYGAMHLHKELPADDVGIKRAKICDCYISNTYFETEKLLGFGVQKNKIETIGTGIELNDFVINKEAIISFKEKYQIQQNDILIGHIGRLSNGKGVGILLRAFASLFKENKKIKLLLAGTSTDFLPVIKKIIASQNLPVIIIEDFDNGIKPILFNLIDVFVLASQSESFGVVFLEAWACKKPVIATNMGATASLLSDDFDSLLFNANDEKDLSKKIQLLIQNKELRIQLGENGYSKVINNFTWKKIVEKYRNAYLKGIENFKAAK